MRTHAEAPQAALQWGRVRENAETEYVGARRSGHNWLQWGRVRENAETPPADTAAGRGSRFNGAAFVRTRKHALVPQCEHKRNYASMGPRS